MSTLRAALAEWLDDWDTKAHPNVLVALKVSTELHALLAAHPAREVRLTGAEQQALIDAGLGRKFRMNALQMLTVERIIAARLAKEVEGR